MEFTESHENMAYYAVPSFNAASDITELSRLVCFIQISFLPNSRGWDGRSWTRVRNTQGLWRNAAAAGETVYCREA